MVNKRKPMPQSDAGDFAALFLLSCNICETFSGYISDGQSQAKKRPRQIKHAL